LAVALGGFNKKSLVPFLPASTEIMLEGELVRAAQALTADTAAVDVSGAAAAATGDGKGEGGMEVDAKKQSGSKKEGYVIKAHLPVKRSRARNRAKKEAFLASAPTGGIAWK
jgi:hypothetical protein